MGAKTLAGDGWGYTGEDNAAKGPDRIEGKTINPTARKGR